MPHLNEANSILPCAQSFHDAVDAIAGNSEDYIDAPTNDPFDQNIGGCFCHHIPLSTVHSRLPLLVVCWRGRQSRLCSVPAVRRFPLKIAEFVLQQFMNPWRQQAKSEPKYQMRRQQSDRRRSCRNRSTSD